MTEREALFSLLAAQTVENPNLRESFITAMLAVMTEGHPPDHQTDYLTLLEQLEQQRRQAEQSRKPKSGAALKDLSEQIREELRHTALALHQALQAGTPEVNIDFIRRLGFDPTGFPAGFPEPLNIPELSKRYLDITRQLVFLNAHFPQQLPDIRKAFAQQKQRISRTLWDIALSALSLQSGGDPEYMQFRKLALDAIQTRRAEAESALMAILTVVQSLPPSVIQERFENWQHLFSGLTTPIIKTLQPKFRKTVLRLLLASQNYASLELLFTIPPGNPAEQDLFDTLMTLRFGEEFQRSAHRWQSWLRQHIQEGLHKTEALTFWQGHQDYLPGLLADYLPALATQPIFRTFELRVTQDIEEMSLQQFLDVNRNSLLPLEIDILEQALYQQSAEPEFAFDELEVEEVFRAPVPKEIPTEAQQIDEESPEPISPLSPIAGGVVDAIMDTAIEGNFGESSLIAALDHGGGIFEERLTVTIDDDEAESEGAAAIESPHAVSLQEPPAPEEPEESIWNDHIFPFVKQNLVFVLSPTLIFVGLLLLVFTLWDKAAWIRYGLTPFMVVSVAYALARIGVWLKGEDIQSETPIAMIQSAAIFLAPMSLLFVALLSADKNLTPFAVKVVWGVVLSGALLASWWYIFMLAATSISRKIADIHSPTLLLLNALLLLLPVALLTNPTGLSSLNSGNKAILVSGFYAGFLVLIWSMRKVLGQMLETLESSGRTPIIFYSVTCVGTFAVVWGLTHARLLLLPQPHTYGPLLLLSSYLISVVEFKLLALREQHGRITSLSYSAYFLIGLGVLLSIGHDYVRVIALLLAGLVWFYQALKLKDERHFNIAMIILTLGFSVIALVREFPPLLFPYLTLLIIGGLYLISLSVKQKDVSMLAARLTPVYMSFAFVVSVLWQWADDLNPVSYGLAFMVFGLFSVYLGAKTDRLIHIHAGAGYLVAALPYLGTVDMNLYTLRGNTLVFGLALVGIFWTMLSSASRNAAIRDSRSTVLWNIGILAFCLMCLRVILGDTFDFAAFPMRQFQLLSGPVLIAGLMLLAGFFTRSYVPVYLALVVLVIIFPEIKDRFNIPMYSGLGSTASGIGFLLLTGGLSLLPTLREEKSADLIWRKKAFPFQAENHYLLYANPLMVAAFFLFTRTIFVTYPKNYFRPLQPFSLKTCLAVLLSGTAYHVVTLWFKKSWFSYVGFLAAGLAIIHSCYVGNGMMFDPAFLPLFILTALLYGTMLYWLSARLVPAELAEYIQTPWRQIELLALWIAALGVYLFYSRFYAALYQSAFFIYWVPLLAYLFGIALWRAWNRELWPYTVAAHLLFWQLVILGMTRGTPLPYIFYPNSVFYLSTAIMTLGVTSLFFLLEWVISEKKFRVLSPMLWMSLLLLGIFSFLTTAVFYLGTAHDIPYLVPHIILWGLVSLVLGRFLNLGPLWLWSVFLFHLLLLPDSGERTRFYLSFHPFTLACIAIALSAFSVISTKIPWLYRHRHCWPWGKIEWLAPSFLFAIVSHLIIVCVFLLSLQPEYRHEWLTIGGLFLAALPALFAAHQLGFSRRFLFGVPYALAWVALMLALGHHFPANGWLVHLHQFQLVAIGCFAALLTGVISDLLLPSHNRAYRDLKFAVGAAIIALVGLSYVEYRELNALSWQWLTTSGILSAGAGLYFRYGTTRIAHNQG